MVVLEEREKKREAMGMWGTQDVVHRKDAWLEISPRFRGRQVDAAAGGSSIPAPVDPLDPGAASLGLPTVARPA